MEPHLCKHVACSSVPRPSSSAQRSQRSQPRPQEAMWLGGCGRGGGHQDSCEEVSSPSQRPLGEL